MTALGQESLDNYKLDQARAALQGLSGIVTELVVPGQHGDERVAAVEAVPVGLVDRSHARLRAMAQRVNQLRISRQDGAMEVHEGAGAASGEPGAETDKVAAFSNLLGC